MQTTRGSSYNTDINTGSGSLLVGLAGVILGEVIFPTSRLGWKLASIIAGAILYHRHEPDKEITTK